MQAIEFAEVVSVRGIGMRKLDNEGVIRLLRLEVAREGGQSSWARTHRIDRTLLNRVLAGQKPPTKDIVRAIKLCNVYSLEDDARTVSAVLRRSSGRCRE